MALSQPPPDLAQWGVEALEMIRREYYLPKSKLYAERSDRKQPAFNWGVGVMLSALNAAARHDSKYKPWLREYADASRIYWNKGGYDVLPAPKPKDRYYDDNAWMALALTETHELLGDKKYLDWAQGALKFALQGEAKDGGIYWREVDRASRNTCSNAPTAAACLAIHKITRDEKLLDKAKDIYEWTLKNLRDPEDGLYWDSIANSGKVDRTKWTYNTALMIRAAVSLSNAEPLGMSKTIKSSEDNWLVDGKLNDPGRFAHLLLEAWVRVGHGHAESVKALQAVRDARSSKGFYPSHWGQLAVDKNSEILDQAAFARACFVLDAGK